jgi:hypothetical protein
MDTNTTEDASPPRPRYARRIVLFMIPVLAVPVILAFVLFPFLMEQPFDSIEELKPENIATFRVQILNRKEIDGGDEISPYFADEADYKMLLEPLLNVPETNVFEDARGPWLGEYRIVTKTGRKGTIRLYWTKKMQDSPEVPAKLRFQIGTHKFEGGTALAVILAAKTAEGRGRKNR